MGRSIEEKYDGEYNKFYGDYFRQMCLIEEELNNRIAVLKREWSEGKDQNPIEHYKARIKSPESMREKLTRKGLPVTAKAAISDVKDAIGIRIVCTFVENVYDVVRSIQKHYRVIKEKDYIKNPKPNGYRSYHMIISISKKIDGREQNFYIEIQIRTIAMDCWASLEHQLKYKHEIRNQKLIVGELKRCADTMASADLMMQTIREMIEM